MGSAQIRPRRCAYFMALFAEVITPAMAAISLITSIGSMIITSFSSARWRMIEYGKQLPAKDASDAGR